MSEMAAEFFRRTGKRLDQCTDDEIIAEIAKLQADGEAHRRHTDELRHFGNERGVDAVANDNVPTGRPAA